MKESNILKLCRMRLSTLGVKIFRINVGKAWTSNDVVHCVDTIVLRNPRPFLVGVPKGYPDLTGWKSIKITPEMVGQKIAVFVAVEIKQPKKHLSPEQVNFLEQVEKAGGIAGVARCEDDCDKLMGNGA